MSRLAAAFVIGALSASTLALVSLPAHAVKFRRPYNSGQGVNYGFDNNGGGGCTDFHCGGVCYDGHSGTDFPLPLGTPVVAAASGTIGATNNGCANYGGLGNTCGGRCGNYVRIDYSDGTSTLYCHMQLNSIAVGVGQHVGCGDYLGNSASSGNSSGPHLHFGVRVGGANRDPFAGGCSQGTSWWVDQGSYPHNVPSSQCEVVCQCSPGQVQHEGCGNCGTHQRTCGGNCHWGGWSDCVGQGPCAAGSVDTRACCDCGTQSRSCGGNCQWGDWGGCQGSDPNGGNDVCDTQEPGICGEGRVRCRDGCTKCVRIHEPRAERCDDVDEDCDGTVDNGFPAEMGDPRPQYAARLLDASSPQTLAAGQSAQAWAVFLNEGTATWKKGDIWLASAETWEGRPSHLADMEKWPSFQVASVLDDNVLPGEQTTFVWSLRPATDAEGTLAERFQLTTAQGTILRCPSPNVEVKIRVSGAAATSPSDAPAEQAPETQSDSGCGCRTAGGGRASALLAWSLLAGLVASSRLRRRRSHPSVARSGPRA
ncbi:MAG TPA: M23 family metallopeptidase [Polyangiaceae bacterium]|nr:M23 family metallopeptidase [Polyangiaceae bacterium]